MTGSGPPRCKTCGIAEFGHICTGGGIVNKWIGRPGEIREVQAVATRKGGVVPVKVAALAEPERGEAEEASERLGVPSSDGGVEKKKRGRPKKVDDRKAYKAEKQREYRAKNRPVSDGERRGKGK